MDIDLDVDLDIMQQFAAAANINQQRIDLVVPRLTSDSLTEHRPDAIPGPVAADVMANQFWQHTVRTTRAAVAATNVVVVTADLLVASTWENFCLSTGYVFFVVASTQGNRFTLRYLRRLGNAFVPDWDVFDAVGNSVTMPTPAHVQVADPDLIGMMGAAFAADAQQMGAPVAAVAPAVAGALAGGDMVHAFAAGMAPFLEGMNANHAALQLAIGNQAAAASQGSTLKRIELEKVRRNAGMVDDTPRFFSPFYPASCRVAPPVMDDGGGVALADGCAGAPVGAVAGEVPEDDLAALCRDSYGYIPRGMLPAREFSSQLFCDNIKAVLLQNDPLNPHPYKFTEEKTKALFALFDFGQGGKADIADFHREGKPVKTKADLMYACEAYSRFLRCHRGMAGFADGIDAMRYSLMSLADGYLVADNYLFLHSVVQHTLSRPSTVDSGMFVFGEPPPDGLSLSARMVKCMTVTATDPHIAQMLSNAHVTKRGGDHRDGLDDSAPKETKRAGRGGGRGGNGGRGGANNVKKKGETPSAVGVTDDEAYKEYCDAFNAQAESLGVGRSDRVCRKWAGDKAPCAGQAQCQQRGRAGGAAFVHAWPSAIASDAAKVAAAKTLFISFAPPGNAKRG